MSGFTPTDHISLTASMASLPRPCRSNALSAALKATSIGSISCCSSTRLNALSQSSPMGERYSSPPAAVSLPAGPPPPAAPAGASFTPLRSLATSVSDRPPDAPSTSSRKPSSSNGCSSSRPPAPSSLPLSSYAWMTPGVLGWMISPPYRRRDVLRPVRVASMSTDVGVSVSVSEGGARTASVPFVARRASRCRRTRSSEEDGQCT
mmetsp:Transcript_30164/g.87613  ORF Transcript_30164/g.87613 Transcript_30164/m.87613 type:complete len:206 (+) Transcript_30164:731-1348(+)